MKYSMSICGSAILALLYSMLGKGFPGKSEVHLLRGKLTGSTKNTCEVIEAVRFALISKSKLGHLMSDKSVLDMDYLHTNN